ncbi:NLR family CARD domain-containing protein 4-like isoform X2 [Patiria miniata]|nr:NLR family CARD domain-containing protein 4-like isoform X2 [Patiria miniata]
MKWYKKTHSYVQLNPGVPDDQRPIVGIYTKVQIRTKKGTVEEQFTDEIAYSTEYEKIFKCLNDFDRLILFGKGGVGKSTIFDMIAYDWADESNEILNRFKLVFLLKMCALVQESDLVDSTFDQLLGEDSGIAKDELDIFILANPSEVLILLDGFDEMKTKSLDAASFGSVLNALNRTRYRDCVIFVSTRPSHFETLMSKTLVQNPCTHVEVLGFNEEDVKTYVLKFYDKDPDSGNELIQTIGKSTTLRDFATNPMLLLLMCLLWGEKKQLPETTSRLFTKAVNYMFTRKDEDTKTPEKRKANVSGTVIAIGQTALRGLMSANQQFSFQEDEFEPKALDLALKAGILNQQRVIKHRESHNNIQFMHKTVQEFCAAKYLQSVHMSNPGFGKRMVYKVVAFGKFQNYLRQLCRTMEGVYASEFLLSFCSGDNEKCMTDIVKLLDRKFSKDPHRPRYQSNVIRVISQNCFFESQSVNVPRCLTSDSNIPSDIYVRGNNDLHSLIYLLEIFCRSDSHTAKLARIETITLCNVFLVSDIAFSLCYMKNLSKLMLRECPLVKGDLEKTLSSLRNQHLTSLSIKDCTCSALGHTFRVVEWAPHMKHLTSLDTLQISNCDLQGTDMLIVLAEGNVPKLTDLVLTYSMALSGTAELWAKELPTMTLLSRLELSWCNLTATDFEHIVAEVCDMPRLTALILTGNFALSATAELWGKHLPKMAHLNQLSLRSCCLAPTDINHIASAVGDMPRLTSLNLSHNGMTLYTRISVKLWAMDLPKMTHLNRLDLSQCYLTPTDTEHILTAVGDMPRLTELNLEGNNVVGRSAMLLAERLPRLNLRI